MPARQSNGLRVFIALLGTVIPLAPGLVSGCGSSGSAAPAPVVPDDATIPLRMVVTGGGGGASSSGGAIQNPFGDLPDGSGSGSGSGGSSGDGSDDGTADGGAPSDGSSSDAPDSGPPPGTCVNYVAPLCGVN